MPLENWTKVSVHEVYLAFLKAERYKIASQQGNYQHIKARLGLSVENALQLVDKPDLESAAENDQRLCLLNLDRSTILSNIPPDTEWFSVDSLEPLDLGNLNAITMPGNSDPQNPGPEDRRVPKVVEWFEKAPEGLGQEYNLQDSEDPAQWDNIILWGHKEEGDFTILEGNHRLISYHREVERGKTLNPFSISAYVGTSRLPCIWHRPDHFLGIPPVYPLPG